MQTAFLDPHATWGKEENTRQLLVSALEQEVGLLASVGYELRIVKA